MVNTVTDLVTTVRSEQTAQGLACIEAARFADQAAAAAAAEEVERANALAQIATAYATLAQALA